MVSAVLASLVVPLEELVLGAAVTVVAAVVVGELSAGATADASVVAVVVVVVQSSDVVSFVQSVHSSRSATGSKSCASVHLTALPTGIRQSPIKEHTKINTAIFMMLFDWIRLMDHCVFSDQCQLFYSESLFGNPRRGSCDNILVIKRLINIKQFCSIQFQLILLHLKLYTCHDVPDVSSLGRAPKSTKLLKYFLDKRFLLFYRLKLS